MQHHLIGGEIGKERIRRVIKSLKDGAQGNLGAVNRPDTEDLGFKVLKLCSPSIPAWKADEDRDSD
jgi:hypothetical protein